MSQLFPWQTARKLDPYAEDEEDQRERHRMEATLKLMGIRKASAPCAEDPCVDKIPDQAVWTFASGKTTNAGGADLELEALTSDHNLSTFRMITTPPSELDHSKERPSYFARSSSLLSVHIYPQRQNGEVSHGSVCLKQVRRE